MQASFATWVSTANVLLREISDAKTSDDKLSNTMLLANQVLSLITNEPLREPSDIVGENILTLQNSERYDAWFQPHPFFEGTRAVFDLFEGVNPGIQAKLYWLKKRSNALMAGAVHFTPNWEDAEWSRNDNYKVGIDFFLSPDGSAIHVVLSNLGKLRVLELSEKLTNTDVEVLEKWFRASEVATKDELHRAIWESFKLQPVNAKFYLGISGAFTELHEHLVGQGKPDQDSKMFSSRLLGRLIFVWFMRKMSLINKDVDYFEPYGIDSSEYYGQQLERLFFRTFNTPVNERGIEQDGTIDLITPYLSGGLFEPRADDWVGQGLVFPNKFFTRLFTHFSDFNFTTDESTPDYEQVAIDPEMLGRVFESLLATQLEATGEQARKAKGAFYTPREIVSFMCKESVAAYLESFDKNDEKWKSAIRKILFTSDQDWASSTSNHIRDIPMDARVKLSKRLFEVKTLDPACGSGAFPLGLLQLLTSLHIRLNPQLNLYDLKLRILQNCIFGVDIEPMAVEISKLRSWLSLIIERDTSEGISPLPNLDFNYVCANSLNYLAEAHLLTNPNLQKSLESIRLKYFSEVRPDKKRELQAQYNSLRHPDLFDERGNQLRSFNPFDSESVASFFDPEVMFGITSKFDLVLGNPPYVAPKGIPAAQKEQLLRDYGFSDDLYCHFFFRSFDFLKPNGTLGFITSKTYWTIQSKRNLRQKLLSGAIRFVYDTANPFESALVDTAIVSVTASPTPDNEVRFLRQGKDYSKPEEVTFLQHIYSDAVNQVFFEPNTTNLAIYDAFNSKATALLHKWWPMIRTSAEKRRFRAPIETYLGTLNVGDFALLGTLVEGGQGMATGNNGRFLAVLDGSQEATLIKAQRAERLHQATLKFKLPDLPSTVETTRKFLGSLSELEIMTIFESAKASHGNDLFGKGFIYRVAPLNSVKLVDEMTDQEKEFGLEGSRVYVPYDKGDKDGNSWYYPTKFLIDWGKDSVSSLRASAQSKGKGAAVIRNPEFYFRPGVSWILTLNENSEYLKARLRAGSVFDVNAMSMFVENGLITEEFLTCLLNSYFVFAYQKTFVNGTSAFQINDAKQIPVVIPSRLQLEKFNELYYLAKGFKERYIAGELSKGEESLRLQEVQLQVDSLVLELYGLPPMLFAEGFARDGVQG